MQYLAAICILMGVIVSLMSGQMKIALFHKGAISMNSLRLRNINAALRKAAPEDRKQIKRMRAFHLISVFFLVTGGILFCVWLLRAIL